MKTGDTRSLDFPVCGGASCALLPVGKLGGRGKGAEIAEYDLPLKPKPYIVVSMFFH